MKSSHRASTDSSAVAPPQSRRRSRQALATLAVAALAISACGSEDDTVATGANAEQSEAVGDAEALPVDTEADPAVVEADPAALQQTGPIAVEGTALDLYETEADDPSVGATAPVVRGESFDGSEVVIGAPADNPTLVVFLAHWCPHCNAEVPVLVGLEESGRMPDDLDVVGVSTAAASDRPNFPPSEWIENEGWPWPTMADDEVGSAINALGGTSFPFAVVVDSDGTVLARRAGEATADETVAFLDDALATTDA